MSDTKTEKAEKNEKQLKQLLYGIALYELLALRLERQKNGLNIYVPELAKVDSKMGHRHWIFNNGCLHVSPYGMKKNTWKISNFVKRGIARYHGKTAYMYFPALGSTNQPLLTGYNRHGVNLKLLEPIPTSRMLPENKPASLVIMIRDSSGRINVLMIDSLHRYVYPRNVYTDSRNMPSKSESQIELPTGISLDAAIERASQELLEIFFAEEMFTDGSVSARKLNTFPYNRTNFLRDLFNLAALNGYLNGLNIEAVMNDASKQPNIYSCAKYVHEKIVASNRRTDDIDDAGEAYVWETIRNVLLPSEMGDDDTGRPGIDVDTPFAELRSELMHCLQEFPEFEEFCNITDVDQLLTLSAEEELRIKPVDYLNKVLNEIRHVYQNSPEIGENLCKRLKRQFFQMYCPKEYSKFTACVAQQMTQRGAFLHESDPDATDIAMHTTNYSDAMIDLDSLKKEGRLSAPSKKTKALASQMMRVDELFRDAKKTRASSRILAFLGFQNCFSADRVSITQARKIHDLLRKDSQPLLRKLIVSQPGIITQVERERLTKTQLQEADQFRNEGNNDSMLLEYKKLVAELNRIIDKVFKYEWQEKADGLRKIKVPPYSQDGQQRDYKWVEADLAKQWNCIVKLFYESPNDVENLKISHLNELQAYYYSEFDSYMGDMLVMLRQTVTNCRAHMTPDEKRKNPLPQNVVTKQILGDYTAVLESFSLVELVKKVVKTVAAGFSVLSVRMFMPAQARPDSAQTEEGEDEVMEKGGKPKGDKRITHAFDRATKFYSDHTLAAVDNRPDSLASVPELRMVY